MSYLTTARCRLFYEDTAEQDPSQLDKPAVLFVNGWALSSRYWAPVVDRLVPDYRCITYDQSGTGRTSIDGFLPNFTISGFADEAGLLIEHLGLKSSQKLHVVGHSMGGMVATELAVRYKDALLSATILACGVFEETAYTSLGLMFLGGLIDVSMSFRNLFLIEPFRSLFIRRAATAPIDKKYGDILVEDFTTSDKEATNAVGRFSIDPLALKTYNRHVQAIESPVLCCVGMADRTIPPEGTVHLFELRHAASKAPTRLVQFMNLGHLPMLEDPDHFAEQLRIHFDFAGQFHKKMQPARPLQDRIQIQ